MPCARLARSLALVTIVLSAAAAAQSYPNRSIRMIVPFPAGGASDTSSRVLSVRLGERLKQQIVIDNRTGAAGAIGAELAARAAPDGYTLLFGSASEISLLPAIATKMAYDPLKDFVPVSLVSDIPFALVVHPSLPPRTVKELITLARARPDEINYGSAGIGSTSHLSMALFNSMTGTRMTHVPYKGSATATTDLVAGHLQALMPTLPPALQFAKSGRLRMLGVSSPKRWPTAPEVPTIAEAGVPGYELILWGGVLAPAGTPKEIVALLHREIGQVLSQPDVKENLRKLGGEVNASGPDEFAAYIRKDFARWAKFAKEANLRID
jgi:tripartite-type tricarboxylate transporter receptor subunit TctC